MISDGADIIDVGGESTRPGSGEPVPAEEEIDRVVPVIKALSELSDVPISVDTTKSEVARAALEAGADIVNDISALRFDFYIADAVAKAGAGLVLMHSRGNTSNNASTSAHCRHLSRSHNKPGSEFENGSTTRSTTGVDCD